MKKIIVSIVILLASSVVVGGSTFSDGIKPLLPTSLRVTVLDNLGNTVEGASVTLYASEDDYYEENKPIREPIKTDLKGRAFFKKLEPVQYFIHAEKGDKDNVGEAVSTNELKEGRINLVNVIIR